MTGFAGSEMSKMWMPSKPWPTSVPPQDWVAAPPALTGESHERTRMFPWTTMSPWPVVQPV